MFASLTQQTIEIPEAIAQSAGQTAVIRKLRGGELERAQAADVRNTVNGLAVRRWSQNVKRVMKAGLLSESEAAVKALIDPLNGFDRYELIRGGLLSCTCAPSIEVEDSAPDATAQRAARNKSIDDLDDEAADFFATAILRLTKPGLFQSADEVEAAQKNG